MSRARAAFVLARREDVLHVRRSLNSSGAAVDNPQELLVLSLIQKVFQAGKAIAVGDMVRDPHMGELGGLIKRGYRSLLILPYRSAMEDGVLYVLDPVPRSGKLTQDLVFYSFFSNLLPLAIMQLEDAVTAVEIEPE
jgi:hypothetical protein